ncbi:MAG TPA: RES family NAD+ phosphorylase [Armatimonadota bacterium]|jgi:RES domain-containing protein
MLPRDEALRALAVLDGFHFAGALHRAVHLFIVEQNPGFDPLYSLGPVLRGGRFTPKGGMPTLYLAEETGTALAEANQVAALLDASGSSGGPISPTVVYSFEADLPCVLDLTNGSTRASLSIQDGELERPWENLQARGQTVATQELGRWAFEVGRFIAIRFASAVQPEGHCMAIFTERVAAPAYIRVYDQHGSFRGQLPAPH